MDVPGAKSFWAAPAGAAEVYPRIVGSFRDEWYVGVPQFGGTDCVARQAHVCRLC